MNSIANFIKDKWGYAILLAPILFYWGFWTLNPSYWFPPDPGAWYFLDSLAIFNGKSYSYVDHPGTPVHLIGSLLLALTYPFFESREAFLGYYIAEPETFFFMTNLFLLGMNALTAITFYHTVTSCLKANRILAGLGLSLMFFGIHPQGIESLTFWSHNSFNYPFGVLWLLWLYNELRGNRRLSWKKIVLLGFAAGALGMAQMYFLGWLAAGVIAIFVFALQLGKSARQAAGEASMMAIGGLAGIVSMLAPIYKEVPRFVDWFYRILTNQGLYGTGESGFYSLDMIPKSIAFWSVGTPWILAAIVLILALLAAMIVLRRKTHFDISPANAAMLTALLVQMALLLVVLSKLYIKIRYLLSLAAVLPILFLVLIVILESAGWKKAWMNNIIYIGALAALALALPRELNAQAQKAFVQRDAAVAKSVVVTKLAQARKIPETEIVVVYGSGTPMKCAGLLMANNWIRAFDKEISALCPNQYSIYDTKVDIEINVEHSIPELDDIDWDVVVSPGNHSGLQDTLFAQGATTIPNSWGVLRAKWFFIRPGK
jgi:hypothetical protein